MIFFALEGETAVGCVAMIPDKDGGMEFAESKNTDPVYLYTNRKLIPAIRLYEKFSFREVPLEQNKYLESDMKMVLKRGNEH